MCFAEGGSSVGVGLLLDKGADPLAVDGEGKSAMLRAAAAGEMEVWPFAAEGTMFICGTKSFGVH
jgi:hypothetical protein